MRIQCTIESYLISRVFDAITLQELAKVLRIWLDAIVRAAVLQGVVVVGKLGVDRAKIGKHKEK